MNEKLKLCPFCGGVASIVKNDEATIYAWRHRFYVWCPGCDCLFGFDKDYGGEFDTKEEATTEWNTRAEQEGK